MRSVVAALDIPQEDLALLRQWEDAIGSSLQEMEQAEQGPGACGADIKAWVQGHCGGDSPALCQTFVRQDVQRFGRSEHVAVDGDPLEAAEGLRDSLQAEQLELVQKGRQLRQLLAYLEGKPGAGTFTDAEVHAQVSKARAAAQSGAAKVEVLLGVPSSEEGAELDQGRLCIVFSLSKPASMYLTTTASQASPQDDNGLIVVERRQLRALVQPQLLYMDSFTMANDRWAAMHPLLTYIWLYVLNLWVFMVPCAGSGPFMPEASCRSSCVGFLPWSHMFGPGVSCASPLGIVTETVNPGASVWLDSSQYGLLTPCPGFGRHIGWMLPVVGQSGQVIPGRPLPDRTVLGSHPLSCLNVEGRPDIYTATETYVSPEGQGYDAELVQLLYRLSAENVTFSNVTYFTTSLTQLALVGYYPKSTAWQHHGIQFIVGPNSPQIPGQHSGTRIMAKAAKVLTIEMVMEGLLWSLREKELGPGEMHSMESYHFDSLSPEVLADYVLDQKGTTYSDANCQLYAKNLLDRVLMHGGPVHSIQHALGNQREVTGRFIVFLAILATVVAASVVVQWALLWRVFGHIRRMPLDARWRLKASALHVASALGQDADSLEELAAGRITKQGAKSVRKACLCVAMLQCPALFWYVAVDWLSKKWRTCGSLGDKKVPLVQSAASM